jgi:hypothetical protein
MPLGRYFAFAGTLLLALMFLADWYFPKPVEQVGHQARPSGIRIASVSRWPERIVYDTSRPTIVPPPEPVVAAVEPPIVSRPRDAFAMATPTPAPKPIAAPVRKPVKIAKRQQHFNRVAVYQAPPQILVGWREAW